ncbi:unnamed protein product [Caenorhabditis angaria]|uniref:Receptor L-domain domain-containing protein n=1 Tax=Caenorhabditis angaria TaxID=860376 RepID=A0A9P1ISM1_9PELO|nr:unnamed protein product [Caenorhabditis angaria]
MHTIFLLFLTFNVKFTKSCEQRAKIEYLRYPSTLFIFMRTNLNKDSRFEDDDKKSVYVYDQVLCAIPNQYGFHYSFANNPSTTWSLAKKSVWNHSNENKECEWYTNWLAKLIDQQNCGDECQLYTIFDRIEIVYFSRKNADRCDYLAIYQKYKFIANFNIIHFDDRKYDGYHTLNIRNISAYDISGKDRDDIRKMAENFIDDVLDIPAVEVPPIQNSCDFYKDQAKMFLIYGGVGAVVGMIVLGICVESFRCIIDHTKLLSFLKNQFEKLKKKFAKLKRKAKKSKEDTPKTMVDIGDEETTEGATGQQQKKWDFEDLA